MQLKRNIKSKISILVVLIVYILVIFNLKLWQRDKTIIYWDAISYYAYLPATFIYHDLTLEFTKDYKGEHHFIFWPEKLKNGNNLIKTTMGLSILELPFFEAAHLYALHSQYDAGGYSQPYKVALAFSSLFWFVLGLIFLRLLLLKFFSDNITSLVILLVSLGTNLYYYTIYKPVMPHQFNFALFSIFLYFTVSWYEKKSILKSIIIGISLGLISLIRPTDLLIAIIFPLYGILRFKDIKQRTIDLINSYQHILVIILSAFIIWIPQLLYWKFITGHYLFFSYTDNEHFFWNNPHIIEGLIGYRKGWLLYTPLMIFAIIGLFFMKPKANKFLLPIIIFLPINIYIIFSWWAWWYGGSFGCRPIIESYALLSVPLASFLEKILSQKKVIKIIGLSLVIIFAAYNLFATQQYRYGSIHWDGMTKEAYWDSFGRLHPSNRFKDLIRRPDYDAAKNGIDKYADE